MNAFILSILSIVLTCFSLLNQAWRIILSYFKYQDHNRIKISFFNLPNMDLAANSILLMQGNQSLERCALAFFGSPPCRPLQ